MNDYIEKEKADDSKYKIDVRNTIIGNILWIYMSIFILIFIFIGSSYVYTLVNSEKLLFMIVWMFTTFKLITWVGHPSVSLIRIDSK